MRFRSRGGVGGRGLVLVGIGFGLGEDEGQDFVEARHEVEPQISFNFFGYFLEIASIFGGEDDLADTGAVGGQDLVFDAADGQHGAAQGELAAHRDLGFDRCA